MFDYVPAFFNRASMGYVNENNLHVNETIQYDKLESINVTTTCIDKDKQTLSEYNIKGKEKTSSTSKNK